MTVRDQKRNKQRHNNQSAELANLAAIAEYNKDPKVTSTATLSTEPANPTDQEIVMKNNEVNQNEVKETPVTEVKGQAGDITIDCSQPVKESFVTPEVLATAGNNDNGLNTDAEYKETTATDDNPSETPVVAPEDVIKNWVLSQDAPILKSPEGLNIHTLTGKELLEVAGLPTSIPLEVMEAVYQLVGSTAHLSQYLPILTTLVHTATDEETRTVGTEQLADTLLAFVKPFLNKIILPKWDAVIKGIEGFIKPPVEATEVAEVTKVDATVEIKLDPKALEAETKAETKEEDYKTDPALLVPAEITILDTMKQHQEQKAVKLKIQEQAIAKPTPLPVKTETFGDLLQGMDVLGS